MSTKVHTGYIQIHKLYQQECNNAEMSRIFKKFLCYKYKISDFITFQK